MTLYEALKAAKSEEDIKDIYIKALSLKNYTKGFVAIRTPKIWFEAKIGSKWPTYKMFYPSSAMIAPNQKDVYDKWVESVGRELEYRHKGNKTNISQTASVYCG